MIRLALFIKIEEFRQNNKIGKVNKEIMKARLWLKFKSLRYLNKNLIL